MKNSTDVRKSVPPSPGILAFRAAAREREAFVTMSPPDVVVNAHDVGPWGCLRNRRGEPSAPTMDSWLEGFYATLSHEFLDAFFRVLGEH